MIYFVHFRRIENEIVYLSFRLPKCVNYLLTQENCSKEKSIPIHSENITILALPFALANIYLARQEEMKEINFQIHPSNELPLIQKDSSQNTGEGAMSAFNL